MTAKAQRQKVLEGITIREAVLSDAPGIARVRVDTWRITYRGIVPDEHLDSLSYEEAAYAARMRLNSPAGDPTTFVAEAAAGEIIGFALACRERGGSPAYAGEVSAIYVLQAYQGRGVGRQLMCAAARNLRERGMASMLIWVLADNPSRAFYERLGGKRLGAQTVTIGGRELDEVAYGWDDVATLIGAAGTE